jgi:glycosyltransferase involved in cell wall biosynthesis
VGRSIYICYFGVRQPLVQTQVIPYLRELVKGGHEIELLTFEPEEPDKRVSSMREGLKADGIVWHWLRYHKRPSVPATLFDIANGARFIRRLATERRFDILHSRSHVPMMMAALARRGLRDKPKLLFDIRGFFPEEYVDAGIWPEGGAVFRAAKRTESWLMKEADGIVVLTDVAKGIISETVEDRPIEVIPCCVDLGRFETAGNTSRRDIRERLGIGDRYTLVYTGALGGWYLTDETVALYGRLKRSHADAFALVLTQSDPNLVKPPLLAKGYGENDLFVGKVDSSEIPKYLSAADAAVSLIKPCYSKKASSPTKNAEYLACGLPIVANSGIGDTDRHILEDRIGVLIDRFDEESLKDAIDGLDELKASEGLSERCKASARTRFSLELVGGERYRRLYESLLAVEG